MRGGESSRIPCAVARGAERAGDVVFAHQHRIVQMEPRVRPSEHGIGVLAPEQPSAREVPARGLANSVGQRGRVVE